MTKSPKDWIAIAIVARPHALRGAVLLKALTRTSDELLEAPLERVTLRHRGQIGRTLTIASMALHKGVPYVFFEEITDRTGAEQIVGMELVIPEDEMWELAEGRYFLHDLIDLEAVDHDTGAAITRVLRAEEGPAHDYLVLAHPDGSGREVLLPLVPEFVLDVDLERRRVAIRIPEGLLDL